MTRIAELRKLHNMTQSQLAAQMIVDQTTVSLWECEKGQPDADKLYKMAQIFGVSMEYLIGKSDVPGILGQNAPNCVPVFKRLNGSQPDKRDRIGYEFIPMEMLQKDVRYIGLRLSDDSMSPRFLKGDTVLFRIPPAQPNGIYALVSVENGDARLRRIHRNDSGVLLQAINSEHESEFYLNSEVKKLPVNIIGTVIQTIRREK